jgi:hypothetical protein
MAVVAGIIPEAALRLAAFYASHCGPCRPIHQISEHCTGYLIAQLRHTSILALWLHQMHNFFHVDVRRCFALFASKQTYFQGDMVVPYIE